MPRESCHARRARLSICATHRPIVPFVAMSTPTSGFDFYLGYWQDIGLVTPGEAYDCMVEKAIYAQAIDTVFDNVCQASEAYKRTFSDTKFGGLYPMQVSMNTGNMKNCVYTADHRDDVGTMVCEDGRIAFVCSKMDVEDEPKCTPVDDVKKFSNKTGSY